MHSFKNYDYQLTPTYFNHVVKYSRSCQAHHAAVVPEGTHVSAKQPKPTLNTVARQEPELPEQELLRQIALAEAKAGNYEEAIALFDDLLEQNPLNATDYNNRGLVHFKCHHAIQALADFNMAIELDATLDDAYNNRANCHAHQGNFMEALLDYDIAINLNPCNVRALINRGITFRDLNLYNRALECFDSAAQFSILREHTYLERGRTYHLRGDWNCAIADYQRVITYVVEICDYLGEREIRLLTRAEDSLEELLAPLTEL